MKRVAILGSTGSIGTQSLDVIKGHPGDFVVSALTCGRNIELFRKQLAEFRPAFAATADAEAASILSAEFPGIRFAAGMDGICEAAGLPDTDIVINSLLGMMGLRPTFAAIEAGKDVAFANKETLVAGGSLIMDAVKKKGAAFLPVDSEHSAIFQALQGNSMNPVKRIILTASGGPFRGYTKEQLAGVTRAQALKHPNWTMGAKITIDSATMMNKGLEVIEASHLFSVPSSKIEVVVHPESVLHSAVEFEDGCVVGQMGLPDMRMPIAYALSYPRRLENVGKSLDLTAYGTLTFEKPDPSNFRCLGLAYRAIEEGHSSQIVLNAANEEAVKAFLEDRISFNGIADTVEKALDNHKKFTVNTLDEILELEKETRKYTQTLLK